MDALEALQTRNSSPRLTGEVSQEALKEILNAGLRAPDHAQLRPWRILVVEGEARERLGSLFAQAMLTSDPHQTSEQLEKLKVHALQELKDASIIKELESWRVLYLGRNSELTKVLRSLATFPLEERKAIGTQANQVKVDLEYNLKQKEQVLREAKFALSAQQERIDITLPGRSLPRGRLHPITQTLYEICDIFASLGFQSLHNQVV